MVLVALFSAAKMNTEVVKEKICTLKNLIRHSETISLDGSDPDISDNEKVCCVNVLKSTSGDMKIFERESYLKIYDLLDSQKYTLVSGNPGIGKSYFALYIIWRLMKENELFSIIYVNKVEGYSAYISKDMVAVVPVRDCLSLTHYINANTWYIHDCGTHDGKPAMYIASQCFKTVVCSIPDWNNYADFVKEGSKCGIQLLYMPPWSLLECQTWNAELEGNSVNYEDRFWHWGGNARQVFHNSYSITDLDQAVRVVHDANTILRKLNDVTAGRGTLDSHRLLHLFPTDDSYNAIEVRFASRYVSQQVYRKLVNKSVDGVLELIKTCSGQPTLAGIRGPLFEQLSHENFFKCKEYDVRNLRTGEQSTLKVKADRNENFSEFSQVKDRNVYYYPVSKTFTSIDSILPTDKAFQMTVVEKHPVQYHGLTLVKDQLNCRVLELYFVVPNENFANFEIQKYLTTKNTVCKDQDKNDIEQFVLSMDIVL